MFIVLLRKIISTKWMVLCLLAGFIMAAGMMSAVPIYMDASLQRMLVKDMQEYQLNTGNFPGEYNVWTELRTGTSPETALSLAEELPALANERVRRVGIPVNSQKTVIRDSMLFILKGSVVAGSSGSVDRIKLTGMTDFQKNINIADGQMYSNKIGEDGIIEAVVTDTALKTLGISIGEVYDISPSDTFRRPFKVRITGVFEPNDPNSIYWAEKLDTYINALVIDYNLFLNLMTDSTVCVSEIYVHYGLDYQKLDMNRISAVTNSITEDSRYFPEMGFKFSMNANRILLDYVERAESLTRILWALQIPVMIMLGFYLFMVSRLNVERERNEIALLKSRGASSRQVFAIYAGQAGILGGISFICAPLVGLALCRFLGVSDGFLEFVNRHGLSAKITPVSLAYAAVAVVIFFMATMLPVIPAARLSIVQYKQSRSKAVKIPLWEKTAVDFILIAAGIAFIYVYVYLIEKSIEENRFTPTGEIDPLLFVFSSCFIMGAGLLFLRLYPLALSVVYRLGRRFWNPSQYIAMTSVKRNGGERFLMLFLVITFSLGIFSANTARTINNNKRDMLYYSNGADVTLREYWLESSNEASLTYQETDFSRYENLAGVQTATKVLRNETVRASINETARGNTITLMAVEPDKFAQTAWFRDDLLPVHWYNYCNALVDFRSGIIISRSMSENMGLELGDSLFLKWGKDNAISATVIAVVDWWPGISPLETDRSGSLKHFAIMNYNFVRAQTELEPYEIWLKTQPGASSRELYDDIKANRLPIRDINDSSQMLIAEKTDPRLQSVNGALTLGFTVIMIMTVIGFLIYWILSIKGRTLQFGVLRAMGMSFREIIATLGYEQLLVSGISIAAAFLIGGAASELFVPLFQNMYAVNEQIPPFYVAAARADYVKLYVIIAIMLGAGFAIIGSIIRKTSINKALKLGED
ncbi:MAG: ABC transporter permease [Oscillospiraceae bacterium]|nr:ABC transporter permease [Oscillospiraceae bacterium]